MAELTGPWPRMKRKIELLAPARDLATGMDAVNCGADAVYIGAEEFGARKNAGNSTADIGKLAAYAHKYGARVYAAVNTFLTDVELERARKMIWRLWKAGADAVIAADMGLLEVDLPPIPLIASVQTRTDTPEKALFLERAGFKRLTLSRSLSLDEIKKIRAATSAELECFVHGSVGVSDDGQCYLTYAMEGRPDGRCNGAKYCRKLYTLRDASGRVLSRDKYLLSLKDLNLSHRLGALLDAGVSAFKIEGRLKDRAYVRNTVSYYRTALDAALKTRGLKKSSYGRSFVPFTPDLAMNPNRGYMEFFMSGRAVNIAAPDTPEPAAARPGCATNGDSARRSRAFLRKVMRGRPVRKLGVKLESAMAAGHRREESARKKNRFPYPERELDYSANILNLKALAFYKRHGVVKAGLLAAIGPDLGGRRLLSSRFCLGASLGLCPGKSVRAGAASAARRAEPLYLENEGGRLFRLDFDCGACRMNLYLDKPGCIRSPHPRRRQKRASVRGQSPKEMR